MKIFTLPFIFLAFSNVQAQITAGSITYETRTEYNNESPYARKNEKYPYDDFESTNTYIVEFNENYIRSYSTIDGGSSYLNVQNRKTGSSFPGYIDMDKKTVRFIDTNPETDPTADVDDAYYDEYIEYIDDEKPHLDHYKEDFYKELMKIPLDDTVIIATDETKDILGYSCKKYIMKTEGETAVIWTTEQISGVEPVFRFPAKIKGSMLSFNWKSSTYVVNYEATAISTEDLLKDFDHSVIPEGYRLDLGDLYIDRYSSADYLDSYDLSLPGFIEKEEFTTVIDNIVKEIKNSIDPNVKKEMGYVFITLRLGIDENGKIVSVEPEDELDQTQLNFGQLSKNIQKKCAFKSPFKVEGKPVASVLTIVYSYSAFSDLLESEEKKEKRKDEGGKRKVRN